ncbi:MAG TPA: DUF4185 domain-containing protein [Pseudonocardiaceae bacterium]|nr:DUF4185 domain-containing protein [Pseudonocardiaceae bacterium]
MYVSLIQSDFRKAHHGNFEAVIVEGGQLWYWYRDNSNLALPWTPDNSEIRLPWIRGRRVTGEQDDVAGPGCIIQSASSSGRHGNFEVVVPLRKAGGGVELRHFFRDNNDAALPWIRGQSVTGEQDDVAGPGCIIQSVSSPGRHGNFEVVVPLRKAGGGVELRHFFRDNNDARLPSPLRQRLTMTTHAPWARGREITGERDDVAGPGCIIQSALGRQQGGRFDVVVPLRLRDGSIELRHFFQDKNDVSGPWVRGRFITQSCAGFGAIIQSSFGPLGNGNFEALVDEPRGSVVHYWHPADHAGEIWVRTNRFTILQRHASLTHRAQKVVQLTGEFDREGWNGVGTPRYAFNRTQSRSGIIGTDLGVSFAHQDRLYFLFGDTWRVGHAVPNDDLDAIAYSRDKNADDGVELLFLPRPPLVSGITQGAFEVPLDGVSWNGGMYVFFSTDRRLVGKYAMMGRSILARSGDNGLSFTLLHEVSRYKFINVSTMIVDAREHELPGDGPQLVVFGSGRYRSSDVYLAVKPVVKISEPGGFLFYAGGRDKPSWSRDEEDAVPLFGEGCVGELSIRWNPLLGAWICLYNADWPADRSAVGGIVMRWARRPYGPWSQGELAFSLSDGLGKFMHQPGADHTQEGFGVDRGADLGGMYGPYQITQYAHRSDRGVRIYFTMSTANPYQTMLMRVDIPALPERT